MRVCPICQTDELVKIYKAPCKCLSVDLKCKNGHICHFNRTRVVQGYSHPKKDVPFVYFVLIIILVALIAFIF